MTAELVKIELSNYLEEQARRKAREQRRKVAAAKRKKALLRQKLCLFTVLFFGIIGILIAIVSVFLPEPQHEVIIEQEDYEALSKQYEPQVKPLSDITITEEPLLQDIVFDEEVVCEASVQYIYNISDEDRLLFEQIMSTESYSFWKVSDILSLCTVVVNRVNSSEYPDTFREVLTQEIQFETYTNGRYLEVEITDNAREAVDLALQGKVNLNADVKWFCTKSYYENSPLTDFFRTLNHVYTCRNVYFFTE